MLLWRFCFAACESGKAAVRFVGGTGFRWRCIGGQCNACFGNGRRLCEGCTGLGHCGPCGGDGYTYAGIGLVFRKKNCPRCRGSGDCSLCGNTGYVRCAVCGGCTIYNGLGKIY